MNKFKLAVISLTALLGVLTVAPSYVQADSASGSVRSGVTSIGGNEAGNNVSLADRIKTVVNILLYILGSIAVIMIIIGGIRYTTSNGDSSNTKAGKDTILYAVVGLVVAILAFAIVNFVVNAFVIKAS